MIELRVRSSASEPAPLHKVRFAARVRQVRRFFEYEGITQFPPFERSSLDEAGLEYRVTMGRRLERTRGMTLALANEVGTLYF